MFYAAYRTLLVMFCVLKFYFVDFNGMFTSSLTWRLNMNVVCKVGRLKILFFKTKHYYSSVLPQSQYAKNYEKTSYQTIILIGVRFGKRVLIMLKNHSLKTLNWKIISNIYPTKVFLE